jgi:uncharacterized protein YpiB (UPF0302 family)
VEKSRELKAKVEAIRCFLEQHQPKLPEVRSFLQFLLAKDEILRRLELTEDLSDYRYAILISAKGAEGWPFFYRRGDRFFHKTSQAVVELMKFIPDRIGLCFSTDPPAWSEERQEFLAQLASWHEEIFQEAVARVTRRRDLLEQIDRALASGDRRSFDRLTAELRNLD